MTGYTPAGEEVFKLIVIYRCLLQWPGAIACFVFFGGEMTNHLFGFSSSLYLNTHPSRSFIKGYSSFVVIMMLLSLGLMECDSKQNECFAFKSFHRHCVGAPVFATFTLHSMLWNLELCAAGGRDHRAWQIGSSTVTYCLTAYVINGPQERPREVHLSAL